jgi:ppGpp synthetase/RelA/SpoT-type nucleotidyltranferase
MNVLLTEPQVEKLVQRYLLEMARYERTAAAVAERLRRELRAEAQLRYLLAFRAKHPEDLRGKLLRKAKEGKAEYSYDRLNESLNDVVTDLAGCRIIVYSPPDRLRVASLVRRIFRRPDRLDADVQKDLDNGYEAHHFLVLAPDDELAIRGATCEVQIATVAAHLFNEVEHDISYKVHGHAVTGDEKRFLRSVLGSTRVLDHMVDLLLAERARGEAKQTRLDDASELRVTLERQADRPLTGDFARLFRMLEAIVEPLNTAALERLGTFRDIFERGGNLVTELGIDADDVTCYALGILPDYVDEFAMMAGHWKGPISPLRRAIEQGVAKLRAG